MLMGRDRKYVRRRRGKANPLKLSGKRDPLNRHLWNCKSYLHLTEDPILNIKII